MKISKFPEILGELSTGKQCVPGPFLLPHMTAWEQGYTASWHYSRDSSHTRQPGNKAMQLVGTTAETPPTHDSLGTRLYS